MNLWHLRQREHEVRCEIDESGDGPAMNLFFDGRMLLSYQGVARCELVKLALDERATLESRGWHVHGDAH